MRYVDFWGGAYDLDWACGNDPQAALRVVAELSAHWLSRGLRAEAAQAAERVLTALGSAVPEGLEEEYLVAVLLAAGAATQQQLRRAQRVAIEFDGPFRRRVTVLLWATGFGPFEAPEVVTAVLARNERTGDAWTRAAVQLCTGYPGLTGAGAAEAEQALRTALARFRMLGDRWGTLLALTALAETAEQPREVLDEAVIIAEELGLDDEAALLLCRRAELLGGSEDYGRALLIADRAGLIETATVARLGLARFARFAGDLATAKQYAEAALANCPPELTVAREDAQLTLTALDAMWPQYMS